MIRKNYPTAIITSLFLFFVILNSCSSKKQNLQVQKNAPVGVDVLIASTQHVDNDIEVNGTILANESLQLRSEVSGRLVYLNIQEGKHVAKGTILAKINDADLQAQLTKLKVQLELNKKTEQRLRELLSVNGVNQADYDVALNSVNANNADIAYTQALIDKTVIKAPFDGVIGLRQVSVGTYLSPSDVIATLQQTDHLKVDFTLPEGLSESIKIGNVVDVKLDNGKEEKVKATIIATEPQINQASRNLTVRAVLSTPKANIGAFAKVIVKSSVDNAVMVPTNAIIPDDRINHLVLVKNNQAVFVNVQLGFRSSGNVEIIKGINPGDTVIVSGVLFAKPKSIVKIENIKTLDQFSASGK